MTGVWYFNKDGVIRRVERPTGNIDRKVLVYLPTNEVITSYDILAEMLIELGWERYFDNLDLLQFHKSMTRDLISLPKSFSNFKTIYMYDIVVKNRDMFLVKDAEASVS